METGLPFKHICVVQASRLSDPLASDAPFNTKSAYFRSISPTGRIPILDDDGLVLHESHAINLYLAKRSGGSLGPANLQEDAQMTMWTLWAAMECEPPAVDIIVNNAVRDEKDCDKVALSNALELLKKRLPVLESALEKGGGYLVGGRFTVADINMAEVLRYTQSISDMFVGFPHISRWLSACQSRPAFQEMMKLRDAEQPPEGWRRAYRADDAKKPL